MERASPGERKRLAMQEKVERNPYLGVKAPDGTYTCHSGPYRAKYRILASPGESGERASIEWISWKRRVRWRERKLASLRKFRLDFFHHQGWHSLLRLETGGILIILAAVLYVSVFEPQASKARRVEWLVARASGAPLDQVEYAGDGWVQVRGLRTRINDQHVEGTAYYVNPLRWITFRPSTYVVRNRGMPYWDAIHPIDTEYRGKIWLFKENKWHEAGVTDKGLEWKEPEGTHPIIKFTVQQLPWQGEDSHLTDSGKVLKSGSSGSQE